MSDLRFKSEIRIRICLPLIRNICRLISKLTRSSYPAGAISKLPNSLLAFLAQQLASVRPIEPYPNWTVSSDWDSPRETLRWRQLFWTEAKRRISMPHVRIPWLLGSQLEIKLGTDISRTIYIGGCNEPNEFFFLDRLIKPGMIVVDAGAHEGTFTIFFSAKVGSKGAVLAFEPSRREMRCLKRNISINRMSNIACFECALGDEVGTASFIISEQEHSGLNTLGRLIYDAKVVETTTVELATLDSVLKDRKARRLDFIKADVEGAELRVLLGASETFDQLRPMLMLEILPLALEAQGATADNICSYLKSKDYRIFSLNDSQCELWESVSSKGISSNIFAFPAEKLAQVDVSLFPRQMLEQEQIPK
jgi:FkbM family methyltransferase